MQKTYLNIDDFFTGIAGEEVDFEVPGLPLPVRVRSLETAEVQKIRNSSNEDEIQMTVLSVVHGMVQPKLTTEHVERLYKSKPGALQKISKRILELSGMVDEKEDSPKAGAGS